MKNFTIIILAAILCFVGCTNTIQKEVSNESSNSQEDISTEDVNFRIEEAFSLIYKSGLLKTSWDNGSKMVPSSLYNFWEVLILSNEISGIPILDITDYNYIDSSINSYFSFDITNIIKQAGIEHNAEPSYDHMYGFTNKTVEIIKIIPTPNGFFEIEYKIYDNETLISEGILKVLIDNDTVIYCSNEVENYKIVYEVNYSINCEDPSKEKIYTTTLVESERNLNEKELIEEIEKNLGTKNSFPGYDYSTVKIDSLAIIE